MTDPIIAREWRGSQDADDKSGTASFQVDSLIVIIPLSDIKYFFELETLHAKMVQRVHENARGTIKAGVEEYFKK